MENKRKEEEKLGLIQQQNVNIPQSAGLKKINSFNYTGQQSPHAMTANKMDQQQFDQQPEDNTKIAMWLPSFTPGPDKLIPDSGAKLKQSDDGYDQRLLPPPNFAQNFSASPLPT